MQPYIIPWPLAKATSGQLLTTKSAGKQAGNSMFRQLARWQVSGCCWVGKEIGGAKVQGRLGKAWGRYIKLQGKCSEDWGACKGDATGVGESAQGCVRYEEGTKRVMKDAQEYVSGLHSTSTGELSEWHGGEIYPNNLRSTWLPHLLSGSDFPHRQGKVANGHHMITGPCNWS